MISLPLKNRRTDQIEVVKSSDILYVTSEKEYAVYHTLTDEYRPTRALEDAYQGLKSEGFQRMDRFFVVNMNTIKLFDEHNRTLYFTETVDKNSKFVYVSLKPNIDYVKSYIIERKLPVIAKAPGLMQTLLNDKYVSVSTLCLEEVNKLVIALNAMDIRFNSIKSGSNVEFVLIG